MSFATSNEQKDQVRYWFIQILTWLRDCPGYKLSIQNYDLRRIDCGNAAELPESVLSVPEIRSILVQVL
jgi:hypothetical protein